jgi:hypothetical protein
MEIKKKETQMCDYCESRIMFELNNGEDSYALSMVSVLTCLKIAENNGAIPKIDAKWWKSLQPHYNLGDLND